MQINQKTRYIVFMGVFTVLAIVLYFIEIPLFSGYLKIDFSDLPAVLAGVMFGPVASIIVEFLKNLIHLGIRGLGDTLGYGDLMNFIVGVAVAVPFSAVMRAMLRKNSATAKTVVLSGLAGIVTMVAAGVAGNYLLAPPFFRAVLHVNLSSAALWAAIGSATLLNIVKSVMLTVLVPLIVVANKKYFATGALKQR